MKLENKIIRYQNGAEQSTNIGEKQSYLQKLRRLTNTQSENIGELEKLQSYNRIIDEATRNTTSGNWNIDLIDYINELSTDDFKVFMNNDERIAEFTEIRGNIDIIFYLDYCPNVEED